MNGKNPIFSKSMLRLFRAEFFVFALLLFLLLVDIPFINFPDAIEAFGQGKAVTILIAKMSAFAAAYFICFQFVLSARLKPLDRLFGIDRLLVFHKYLGTAAVIFALLHPMLLYASKIYTLGKFRWELWPEILGFFGIALLLILVITSLWRVFLELKYERWHLIHQCTFAAFVVVMIHSFKLGSDLRASWPKYFLSLFCLGYISLFIWVKIIKPAALSRKKWTVSSIKQLNHNICELELSNEKTEFAHLPGQFGFLKLCRSGMSTEEHPFTISSCNKNGKVAFTIKSSGDFTETINKTKPGDTAVIDAPYGRFSYLLLGDFEHLVLIAGGIGITPFISCLRHMSENGFDKKVTLIWSNKTKNDIIFTQELKDINSKLKNLTVHHILTKEPDYDGLKGHISGDILNNIINDKQKTAVMICGPTSMMEDAKNTLLKIGITRKQICMEKFEL